MEASGSSPSPETGADFTPSMDSLSVSLSENLIKSLSETSTPTPAILVRKQISDV